MASVYFKCSCDKSLAVDASDAGRRVQCPDCGRPLVVPAPEIYWTCACGEEMAAPENLAGATLQCAACEAEHTVPVRLGLRRDKPPRRQPGEMPSDVPSVPVSRAKEIQCPKCGYFSPLVLERCPQCQACLRKGRLALRRCLAAARIILIVGLGWLVASHFERIRAYVRGVFGAGTPPAAAPGAPGPQSGDRIHTPVPRAPASQ